MSWINENNNNAIVNINHGSKYSNIKQICLVEKNKTFYIYLQYYNNDFIKTAKYKLDNITSINII